MELTTLLAKIIGPVLVLRALSIVIDRKHFRTMLGGVEREVGTIAFSLFPVALLMACLGLAVAHSDTSSVAALLIHVIAWGGIVKASALILFPRWVAGKAALLERHGILTLVLVVCFVLGAYFTWFGYLRG